MSIIPQYARYSQLICFLIRFLICFLVRFHVTNHSRATFECDSTAKKSTCLRRSSVCESIPDANRAGKVNPLPAPTANRRKHRILCTREPPLRDRVNSCCVPTRRPYLAIPRTSPPSCFGYLALGPTAVDAERFQFLTQIFHIIIIKNILPKCHALRAFLV